MMDKFMDAMMALQMRLMTLRSERGQGTLEYVGMIIVAAIVVVAVLDVTNQINLGEVFSENLKKVTEWGGA